MDGKRPPGRLPLGLIGLIAMVIVVERGIGRHPLDILDVDDWQYQRARTHAADQARGCDVLGFGDSLTKLSVVPAVVEARSGLRAYNLAICGSQAPASYVLLRRVLGGGATPSAIVVDFHPRLLATGPKHTVGRLPRLLSWGECLELCRVHGDPSFVGELMAGCLLPSVRARGEVRDGVVRLVRGETNRWRNESVVYFRQWTANAGAQVMPSAPPVPFDVREYQADLFPGDFACDPANAEYVRRFLALAASRGITVYWLLTPLNESLHAACATSGFDARYESFVKSWQSRFPNLVAIDARGSGYPAETFFDPSHLGRDGAYVFSRDLGDLLRHRRRGTTPSADRWVTFPRYRSMPTDPDVKDIGMTRQEVAEGLPPRVNTRRN